MVFSKLCSIEHGVEGGNLVDLHRLHLEDLSDLVHRRQSQEVVVLLLGNEEHWNDSAMLVVVWEVTKLFLDLFVILSCKFEWSFLNVILSISVVDESPHGPLLAGYHLSWLYERSPGCKARQHF